jgi:signal transduction histidine kinase/CheY-like chemotaxis protein
VALRFEQRETAIAILIVSVVSVWHTIHDRGPFVVLGSLDQSLGLLAMFVAVLAITGLVLCSLATERRRAEASLRRANAELEAHSTELARQSSAKSDFLSSMSHELRTPLNAIIGFGQMLDLDFEHTLTAKQKEYCKYILTSGNHLLDLVNEVLDLAGIESSQLKLSIEAVNVRDALEDVYATMAPLATNAHISLAVSVPEVIAQIHADAFRLRQVLINLVSNAIKYNRPNGSVSLSALTTATYRVRLLVTDTGIGIGTEQQKRLFEPFQRLGAEYTNVEGTGIGLAISRRLVEKMRGSIGLVSDAGQGSTFWIELPGAINTVSPKISEGLSDASAPRIQAHATCSLLYIEDNPANLRLMEHLLSMLPNVTMLSAATAQLGLKMALAHRPDVIVLDLNLPVMNGFEVLDRLKGIPETRHIPVLALTAAALPQDIRRGLAAGFFNYVTKPLDVNAFLGAVDDALAVTVPRASATG